MTMQRAQTHEQGLLDVTAVGTLIDRLPVTPLLRYTLVVAVLGYFFDSFDNQIVSYVLPVLSQQWNLSPAAVGSIGSAGLWGSVLGAYAWGFISDRWGRVIAFATAALCFGLLTGLTALAQDSSSLLALRLLAGIGLGGMVAIDGAFVAEYAPTRLRSLFVGLVPLAFPLGQFAATLVSLFVIPAWGWQSVFVIATLPALLTFAVRLRVPESPRWLASKGRGGDARRSLLRIGVEPTAIDAASRQAQGVGVEPHARFWEIFSPAHLRDTAAVSIMWLANFPYWGFLVWVPTIFATVYHFSLVRSITYSLAVTGCGFVGRAWSIWLINRFGRRPVIAVFATLTGVMALVFGTVQSEAALLITACGFQFCMDTAFLGINVYTPEVFPTRIRASGASWAYGLGRVLGAIAPMFLGIILGQNLYGLVWGVMCALMLLAATGAILARETRGKSLEQISEVAEAAGQVPSLREAAAK